MPQDIGMLEFMKQYIAQASGEGSAQMTKEQKTAATKQIAVDPKARTAFAETRGPLILPVLDRTATARMVYETVDVADGAQIVFPVSFAEVEVVWTAPSISSYPNRLLEGDEVWVPVFAIKGGVEYGRDLFRDGRFDIAAEATRLLGIRVVFNEDLSGWNLVANVVADANYPAANTVEIGTANDKVTNTTTGEGFFSRQLANDLLTQSEVARYPITDLFLTPLSYGDIRDWMQYSVSPFTQEKIFQAGGLTDIYGVNIHKMDTTEFFSNRAAYGVKKGAGADGRGGFGKMPIKEALTTRENPMSDLQDKIGVLARERLGLFAENGAALVKGIIDR